MTLLCQAYNGLGAGTRYSMGYYQKAGRFFKSGPQPGDQIFFGTSASVWHTGIVEKAEGGRVYTVEGNTSVGSGVVANGGGVARKSYPVTYIYILGYGRPDWSLAEETEDDHMTGEEIYKELNAYFATLTLPDWAKAEFQKAVDAGITDGTNPMQLIPRYQAAIMAKRAKLG